MSEYLLYHAGRIDFPVYPGHPITIACQIARAFPTLGAALEPTGHGWCKAVGSSGVGGGGCNVRLGVEALRKLAAGAALADVLAWADSCSEPAYRKDWPRACEQARRYLADTDIVAWATAPATPSQE